MSGDVADSSAMQTVTLDEHQHLIGTCHRSGRQILQKFQDRLAVLQVAAGEFSDHERMHRDSRALKQIDEPRIAAAKVINPH
jgi:hypothetical protein